MSGAARDACLGFPSWSAATASRLLSSLFPDGLKFTQLPYKLEWAEADARLRAIAESPALEKSFASLGGEVFLKNLRKVHKEYGAALGVTQAKATEPPAAASIAEPLAAVRKALRTYTLRVLAHDEGGDDAMAGGSDGLLAPLASWESAAAGVRTPKAPIPPDAPGGTTPAPA